MLLVVQKPCCRSCQNVILRKLKINCPKSFSLTSIASRQKRNRQNSKKSMKNENETEQHFQKNCGRKSRKSTLFFDSTPFIPTMVNQMR